MKGGKLHGFAYTQASVEQEEDEGPIPSLREGVMLNGGHKGCQVDNRLCFGVSEGFDVGHIELISGKGGGPGKQDDLIQVAAGRTVMADRTT